MGDEKQITVQIKGTAYRFTPLPAEDVERVVMILNMNVTPVKVFRLLTRVLGTSAGPEQWDAITDRWVEGDLDIKELTVGLLEKLLKRQAKNAATAEDAE